MAGPGARITHATLLAKPPQANWAVAWHRDLAIAVEQRHDAAGFTGWSRKGGVWHANAPSTVLAGIVALRIHVDDCGADDGALQVIPGSHADGGSAEATPISLTATAGDVVLMRPLLLHASARATGTSRRRVVHLECTATPLPPPLAWYEAWPFA